MTDEATETLPLDAWHRARGARMVPFAGYAMPIQYDGIMAEHLWTRENAGLFDVSHMGQLLLSGDGVAGALEALLPGDIAGLGEGRMRYSLLLNEAGGILDDLMVTRLGPNPFVSSEVETREAGGAPVARPSTQPVLGIGAANARGLGTNGEFYIVVNGAVKYEDIGHLRENLPDEITLNHMDDRALLALQGPKAVAAFARVVPGVDALYFMESGAFKWNGHDLWVSRSGYTGEDGVEISVPSEAAEALADALCAQPEVKPIGLGARDSLRLEAGLPLYGHDLDEGTDPVEAGLTFAIQKRRRSEGGFPGAEKILDHLASGPPKKRIGLTVEGRQPAREGAEIYAGAALVGKITSGGFAPTLQAPIAMGYVSAAHAAPGTLLDIDVRGKRIAATVAAMPFVPHTYHRKGAAQ